MTTHYDIDMYKAFRKRAVTSADQLEVGKAYYSNFHRGAHILERLLTNKEHYTEQGLETDDNSQQFKWAEFYVPKDCWSVTRSLCDSGFTEHPYNPWLIFENEEDAELCRKALTVTIKSEPWDYWE